MTRTYIECNEGQLNSKIPLRLEIIDDFENFLGGGGGGDYGSERIRKAISERVGLSGPRRNHIGE